MVKPPWTFEQQRQVHALLIRVRQMREHQRLWFRKHVPSALQAAKRAESDVDACLDVLRDSLWTTPVDELVDFHVESRLPD